MTFFFVELQLLIPLFKNNVLICKAELVILALLAHIVGVEDRGRLCEEGCNLENAAQMALAKLGLQGTKDSPVSSPCQTVFSS